MLIPLWKFNASPVKDLLKEHIAIWAGFCIASSGKYLGFFIGPGSVGQSWETAMRKFNTRVQYVKDLGVGMLLSIVSYRMFAVPTTQYIAQLLPPPPSALKAARKAILKISGGPGNWIP
eukprot:5155574-Karenia_brevis.AAC.1